jgi:hypothetical protein
VRTGANSRLTGVRYVSSHLFLACRSLRVPLLFSADKFKNLSCFVEWQSVVYVVSYDLHALIADHAVFDKTCICLIGHAFAR